MTEKLKILIVDDTKRNLIALRQVLSEVDAEIVEASSGNAALAATLDHEFALAILDVQMPGMSGYELAENLRGDEKTRNIPIVFLTAAYADERHRFMGYDAGGVDFITKPYSPEIMQGKVKVFLEIGHNRKELEKHRDHLESLVAERTLSLNERVKEVNCLYSVSSLLTEPGKSIDETLEAVVHVLPSGWQYPQVACAKISFQNRHFGTDSYQDTEWKLSADIVLSNETVGTVTVSYLNECPESDDGPFLKEEVQVLDDIAKQLSGMIARKRAEDALMTRSRIAETFLTFENGEIYNEILQITLKVMESEFGAFICYESLSEDLSVTPPQTYLLDLSETKGEKLHIESFELARLNKKTTCANSPSESHVTLAIVNREELIGLIQIGTKKRTYSKSDLEYLEMIGEVITPLLVARIEADKAEQQRQLTEKNERLRRCVLELLNRSTNQSDTIHKILVLIKEHTGFEAVGMRLSQGDNFPYVETLGFPEEFLTCENFLCQQNDKNVSVLDGNGAPLLECMCGSVLKGLTDPELPFFTKGGSFWTNSNSALLTESTKSELHSSTRNSCNVGEWESVALIPINSGHTIIGLLQINDHHKNCFPKEMILSFEDLASNIGMALARRDLQARYESLFKSSAQGIIVNDALTKHIKFANPAICRMLGYSVEELTKLDAEDIHPQVSTEVTPDRKVADRKVADIKTRNSGDESLSKCVAYSRKDGKIIYADVMSDSIEIAGRQHNVRFFTDVTSHKFLEEQLHQALKLEAVGQLAGGVAHDFNNLLTIILGYGEDLLKNVQEQSPMYQEIYEIIQAGKRAAELTRQLMAFSRKQTLQPKILNLNVLVENLEKMLKRMIPESIELTTILNKDLGNVKADPGQIERILMNLVVNARDAMPQGGKIIISTKNVNVDKGYAEKFLDLTPGKYITLTISDTGIGMNEETKQKLFEPFFTTKDVGKGTGLGLATVHGIVKQSGGNIWVYSEPDMGTTFNISLPQTESSPIVSTEPTAIPELVEGKVKVLLVEDDASLRKLFSRILKHLGYPVTTASNGIEAIAAVEEKGLRPDLIITDVVMPGMSGKVMVDKLRGILPDAMILFMSGYADNVIVHNGILDDGLPFIQKPFNSVDLNAKIREIMTSKNRSPLTEEITYEETDQP